jgi:hypothetical protein
MAIEHAYVDTSYLAEEVADALRERFPECTAQVDRVEEGGN